MEGRTLQVIIFFFLLSKDIFPLNSVGLLSIDLINEYFAH